jgi:Tol biopolymer transport system component
MTPFLALAALVSAGWAQGFGQNHVIVDDFKWRFRSTEHFDIYYYDETEPLVPETARILEKAYADVTRTLDISVATSPAQARQKNLPLWTRRPFFLYSSPNDFQQSNIARVGEGTGGVTEPFKDRFMVYNDGTRQWLDEVTTHEFVHIMQFYVLISGFWKSARVLKSIVYPLWMMEGMPGYATKHIEASLEELTIRDAATSGGLLPISRLEHFGHLKPHQISLAYKQGAAAMEFMATQYGPRKVGEFLKLFETRFETSAALAELVGLDVFQFEKKYTEYLEDKYRRLARKEQLREPTAFGAALTKGDRIPQHNTAPVVSPDGRKMYYLSTKIGYPSQIFEQDLRTGKSRRLLKVGYSRVEFVSAGNFANISRVLALSPDGKTLAFIGTRLHRDNLYLHHLDTGKTEVREIPGFKMLNQPQFSPDGTKVAFSAMKGAYTDLWLYDLASSKLDRLTRDEDDDEMPAFTPDGRALVYSTELPLANGESTRKLFKMNLSDRKPVQLESLPGAARDPIVSPDGKKVLFILNQGAFSEICELDLESGKAYRLTRSIGGSFTPAYAGGEIAFSALRRGDVHVYKGPRADFLAEELAPMPEETDRLPGMAEESPSAALSAVRPYRLNFSTDLFLPALFFSSPGGLFMTAYWQGSDLLGNHNLGTLATFNSSHGFFDYALSYSYGRYRPQFFFVGAGRGQRDLYDPDKKANYNESIHQQVVGMQYPIDRYHRAEMLVASVSDKALYGTSAPTESRQDRLLSYSLVRDTVQGRHLVATRGNRLRLTYTNAVTAFGGNRRYDTAGVEAQEFVELGSQSALALRGVGIQSMGRDRTGFIMGGVGGVRGYDRSTDHYFGNRLAVANAELRFPIFSDLNYYMWYFFPDFYFKAIFGQFFTDAGYAWNSEGEGGRARWGSLAHSVGFGIKIFTFVLQEFPLVVSLDYAHRTTANKGIFYVYLGSVF